MKHWVNVKMWAKGAKYDEATLDLNEMYLIEGPRVLAIAKQDDGTIEFSEQCDEHFGVNYTPAEAIEVLEEAIAWIKGDSS
jgi:hypothetical protein